MTPVEVFTDDERAILARFVTDIDAPVFALVNLPETIKGALFARYSRYPGTLRRLLLDEFADDLPTDFTPNVADEGQRASALYERISSDTAMTLSRSWAVLTLRASGCPTS